MKSRKPIIVLLTFLTVFIVFRINLLYGHYQDSATTEQLANEKTKLEIEKLHLENDEKKDLITYLKNHITESVTSVVALLGVFFTIWKLFQERKKDRIQREIENLRSIDEKFNLMIANLGSQSKAIQVGAAVSIQSFLKDEYKNLHRQILLIVVANLKINHNKTVSDLLINALEKIIRIEIPVLRKENEQFVLDLTRAYLKNCDFTGYDLSCADFAFANMKHANLRSTNLFRAQGIETDFQKVKLTDAIMQEARFTDADFQFAHFHNTNLISAVLKSCELSGCQFYGASMQSAHLEDTTLMNVKFDNANINDAFFTNADFNTDTLKSILKTKEQSWKKAHFDKKIKDELCRLEIELKETLLNKCPAS
jgi:uncharacterized protein YjbI with pentapeptide repeats